MSEEEKYEQVGRAAEHYSHLKGELNHVQEKLNRAFMEMQFLVQQNQIFQTLKAEGGKVTYVPPPQLRGQALHSFEGLLNHHELVHVLEEKQRLAAELHEATERLKALAPHLL